MDVKNVWIDLLAKYSMIKEIYIECEETDPELKTNLQPLNEFRAALDHVMKMSYALYCEENEDMALSQFDKLNSHLNRCFYDICDMLSINYRNKIVEILEKYQVGTITAVVPEYYSDFKPKIETISQRISKYRYEKGNSNSDNDERLSEYKEDVFELKKIYLKISSAQNSLEEVEHKNKSKENKSNLKNLLLGGLIGFATSAIVSIILHFFGI